MTERKDLAQIQDFCRDITIRFRPGPTGTNAGDWVDWVPVSWEAQAGGLCVESAKAVGLARFGLSKDFAASALGAVRFVLETRCLVDWLLDDEVTRPARALGMALREVADWRRNLSPQPQDPGARADYDRYLESPVNEEIGLLGDVQRQIHHRALTLGVQPDLPPKTLKGLMDKLFQDDTAYRIFSDLGSHVGLGTTFLLGGPGGPVRHREDKSVLVRAFCLGLTAAIHLDTAEVVADALGQLEVVRRIREYRDPHKALLERIVVKGPNRAGGLFSV